MFLTVAYNIALTYYLLPAEFGQIATIMIVINVAALLADGGLGVYLIQRHAEVTQDDINHIATIQLGIALTFTAICFAAAGGISQLYGGNQLVWLIAAASISLPLLVMRGMALLLLERSVQINRVVRVELLEELVFAVVAIALAANGKGAWSVVVAQISKALVGSVVAARLGRFHFRIRIGSWHAELRDGLRFGLHYQATQLINMARVSVIPLFIIPFYGMQAGGFVERAWYFSGAALSVILAVQKRVVFPYIARIQHDLTKIKRFVEDSVYISAVLDKLVFLPLLLFAREIILLIFGAQWLPMLPLIYWLLAGNIVFGALSGPLYPVLNGIGQSHRLSRFYLYAFLASWLLIVPLTLLMGIEGVGVAGLLLWIGGEWLRKRLQDTIGPFIYYRQIIKPTIAFSAAWGIVKFMINQMTDGVHSILPMLLWSILACVFYVAILLTMDWKRLAALWSNIQAAKQI